MAAQHKTAVLVGHDYEQVCRFHQRLCAIGKNSARHVNPTSGAGASFTLRYKLCRVEGGDCDLFYETVL
jgi:hypothetical protein